MGLRFPDGRVQNTDKPVLKVLYSRGVRSTVEKLSRLPAPRHTEVPGRRAEG